MHVHHQEQRDGKIGLWFKSSWWVFRELLTLFMYVFIVMWKVIEGWNRVKHRVGIVGVFRCSSRTRRMRARFFFCYTIGDSLSRLGFVIQAIQAMQASVRISQLGMSSSLWIGSLLINDLFLLFFFLDLRVCLSLM